MEHDLAIDDFLSHCSAVRRLLASSNWCTAMSRSSSVTNRIDSWKEIAAYLGRDARTAIRWEKERGLPVHRVPGGQRQAVFAYQHELDAWLAGSYGSTDAAPALSERSAQTSEGTLIPQAPADVTSFHQNLEVPATLKRRFWQSRPAIGTTVIVASAILAGATGLWHMDPTDLLATNPARVTLSHQRILSPLLSNGEDILFPRYEDGSYDIGVVPVQGGSSATVTTNLANPELCALSPDGRSILVRDLVRTRDQLNPLYIQPEGGVAVRVGDIDAYDAAWYPDGRTILYSAEGVVYQTDTSGKVRTQLFNVPGNAFWFKWAPDGKRLRFTVIDGHTEETSIWEFAGNGVKPRRLFPEMQDSVCCGSWLPNGSFFLFQARVKSAYEIWAQRDASHNFIALNDRAFPLLAGAMNYRSPLASKDGRKLFVRAEAPKGELVRYDSRLHQFLAVAPSISARTMAYSRDSNWIVYTSLDDNNLWRCRADGTQCIQLTRRFRQTVMPRWSPDGKTILFMANSYTGPWKVYSVSVDGGTAIALSHADLAMGYPDWSPDGQQLVFSNVPPMSQPSGIYILNIRSGSVTSLPESSGYSFPRWSPDGRSIVAVHDGDQSLYLFAFSSAKWSRLTKIPANYPNWSRDGRYVYFLSTASPARAVFRVKVVDRDVEKFVDLAPIERGPFFFGDWVGLSPDDAPLAVRNSTIEDVYAWDLSTK